MEYMQLSMDDYIQSKNEIKQELGGIVKSFVRIGWQLTRIDKSGAYKHDGYNTIAEFAKAEYGMNPSGVSRFMNVYERYSLPGDTPELQEQYKDFKFAQLTEMLQLPEEDRQIFHAEDKREDIRELKDFNKENENNPMNLLDWKSAQNTEDKLKATIQEFFHEKQGVLNTLYSSEAYQAGNIKGMSQIINPGDSMSYRKGTVFLMFHQEDITVKIFNGEMKNITWEQFFCLYTGDIRRSGSREPYIRKLLRNPRRSTSRAGERRNISNNRTECSPRTENCAGATRTDQRTSGKSG